MFVDGVIEVVLRTMIVCDPVVVRFSETLPFSNADVHILGGVEDGTPIFPLDELETSLAELL